MHLCSNYRLAFTAFFSIIIFWKLNHAHFTSQLPPLPPRSPSSSRPKGKLCWAALTVISSKVATRCTVHVLVRVHILEDVITISSSNRAIVCVIDSDRCRWHLWPLQLHTAPLTSKISPSLLAILVLQSSADWAELQGNWRVVVVLQQPEHFGAHLFTCCSDRQCQHLSTLNRLSFFIRIESCASSDLQKKHHHHWAHLLQRHFVNLSALLANDLAPAQWCAHSLYLKALVCSLALLVPVYFSPGHSEDALLNIMLFIYHCADRHFLKLR